MLSSLPDSEVPPPGVLGEVVLYAPCGVVARFTGSCSVRCAMAARVSVLSGPSRP